MFQNKLIKLLCNTSKYHHFKRTFLSQAYYCNELWDKRLQNPLLQKINLNEFYQELDQRYQKTKRISAVDVDLFVNSIKDDYFLDEMMDLTHKLRLTAETGNTLPSTAHAVIRTLLKYDKIDELLSALDDRLNYGLFLDDYTATILMDNFWKKQDYVSGCRVASQLMLQEDFGSNLARLLALLHCYSYLKKPADWPETPKPEEPEEEVKVRVRYLRNSYNDEHFDLRDPKKIVGKTLIMATRNRDTPLDFSLNILGLIVYGRTEEAKKLLDNKPIYTDILELLPDFKIEQKIDGNCQELLQKEIVENLNDSYEKDIKNQGELFEKWETIRMGALEKQQERIRTAERLKQIEELRMQLKEKEMKLWFFENEEQIELEIDELTKAYTPKEQKEIGKENDIDYVPPEIVVKRPT